MEITFTGNTFTASTPLGLLAGYVSSDGSFSVHTPYTPEGGDTYVYINRIGYRFSFGLRADLGYTGANLIYREGRWSSRDGVTEKASSTIYATVQDVCRAVKAAPGYAVAVQQSQDENHAREVRHLEEQIADLQKKLEALKASR